MCGWSTATAWAATRRSLSSGDNALIAAVNASTDVPARKFMMKISPSVWMPKSRKLKGSARGTAPDGGGEEASGSITAVAPDVGCTAISPMSPAVGSRPGEMVEVAEVDIVPRTRSSPAAAAKSAKLLAEASHGGDKRRQSKESAEKAIRADIYRPNAGVCSYAHTCATQQNRVCFSEPASICRFSIGIRLILSPLVLQLH